MPLINVKAFLKREQYMRQGRRVNRQTKVLAFRNDEETPYVILSHRWIDPTEVDYEEMVDLAKMEGRERDDIRQRFGYKKILSSCEQAKRDGYEWLWVDTCYAKCCKGLRGQLKPTRVHLVFLARRD
ncbi:hypothetical protein SCLCIDRAFT_782279 [Scleroderma citrinum Foug A]|uniref:Heterokaryon incompatibility domain-containing protein n=1 Tax=Scleroderma citrinum Foug A TaxID=1036808 RepID=A0A0C3E349_9AGAM|nr:hypothetical protein SCLCIDRAFT_782279 [Scleroderma citrinum Foug A]